MTTDPTVVIRAMTADDIPVVCEIECQVFSDPWPKSAFRQSLTVASRVNLVLYADGELVGYIMVQCVADEVQIHNIAVHPQHRRRGFAAMLLTRAEEEGAQRGALCAVLDVRSQNSAALGLYQSFGYRMIGRRKNYYRRPVDDALILFRRLDRDDSTLTQKDLSDGMVS